MAVVYLVQHAEKRPGPGDPELTGRGVHQAARTGRWLSRAGLQAVYSSPLRRARQTAEAIGTACGLEVRLDQRLRERANWDGIQPFEDFLRDWDRCTRERDFAPPGGDSPREAGERLRAFLESQATDSGPVAAVTHGGVTIDLLWTILGDAAVPATLMRDGVPSCAITIVDGLTVVELARVPAEGFEPPTSGV